MKASLSHFASGFGTKSACLFNCLLFFKLLWYLRMGCIIICFCTNNWKRFFVFPSRRYHGCQRIHAEQVTQLSEGYIWALGPSPVCFCRHTVVTFATEKLEVTISLSVQMNLNQKCASWLGLSSDSGQRWWLTLSVSLIQLRSLQWQNQCKKMPVPALCFCH